MAKNKDRRSFIKKSILGTGGLLLASNIISCEDDFQETQAINSFLKENTNSFPLGIASFDPRASSVVLWTYIESSLTSPSLEWQIATDPSFNSIIRYGRVNSNTDRDFTVSVEVQDLEENTHYFYRFIDIVSRGVSDIGETLTFSESNLSNLKIASTSCSNYEIGYFNVYKEIANSDVDIVLHLGDYIYEQSANSFGQTSETIALNRNHLPENELISLSDYRTRYKQYRSDENLKLLHQKKPFICIWDDHEIVNDTYKDGAASHQESEGDFTTRKQNALRAYSEYLPFYNQDVSIGYRSFKFGALAKLIILDTRLAGRDKQLKLSDYYQSNGSLNTAMFREDWLSPSRTILGSTQKSWLKNEISNFQEEWLLIGQQVLMGKMYYPLELVESLNEILIEKNLTNTVSDQTLVKFESLLFELVQLKLRLEASDPTLTELEKNRVTRVFPYNLDSWDGYPVEREEILALLETKKTIVLAGDSHNGWHNQIVREGGQNVIQEFATASVTSPGFENLVEDADQRQNFQSAITVLVDQLSYFNSSNRGYLKLDISEGSATSQWVMIDSILEAETSAFVDHTVTIS